jgi:hypothetical protein
MRHARKQRQVRHHERRFVEQMDLAAVRGDEATWVAGVGQSARERP